MTRRLRVGVVFGGRSVEHEVSLLSARSVMAALDPERFEVVPIGVTKDGRWLTSGDPLALLSDGSAETPEGPTARAVAPSLPGLSPRTEAGSSRAIDVVFPLVHGVYGEDGTLQGLLEMADLPYVGAGVLGSAIGMDKDVAKRLLLQRGLPVVPCERLDRSRWPEADADGLLERIGLPCFVKPSCGGSSVGVSKVREAAGLGPAVEEAFRYDRKVLVERAVDAREIEVAVLGNDEPIASVPGEIVPSREFYDYEAKYHTESKLLVPAPLGPAEAGEARRLALEAFRALELAGLARVDLFLERKTGRFYVNEINSLPGFTKVSMYPRLWEASGVPFRELVGRLVDLAMERHGWRKGLKTDYDRGPGL